MPISPRKARHSPSRAASLTVVLTFAVALTATGTEEDEGDPPHWAFAPLADTAPPEPAGTWAQRGNSIDGFVFRQLTNAELNPNPPADRLTLLRRLSFDLIGLPPSPEDIDRFLADPRPDSEAFAAEVDRLLTSPHYGERWGRVWLDAARYADSNGQDENKAMTHAWRYRDWVVEAFNRDPPYDQFITQQIAGDLLDHADDAERARHLTATGFLVLGPKRLAEQDKDKMIYDIIDEQLDTVGRSFLGMTFGCARCHDHLFDPFSQEEYTALASIFMSTRTMANKNHVSQWNEADVATDAERKAMEDWEEASGRAKEIENSATKEATAELHARIRTDIPRYFVAAHEPDADTTGLVATLLERWKAAVAEDGPLAEWEDAALLAEIATADRPQTLVPGKIGGAYRSRKDTAPFDIPHRPELDPETFTIECWVKREHKVKNDDDDRRWIVSKNENEWVPGHFGIMIEGGTLNVYLTGPEGRGQSAKLSSPDDALKLGRWHHLATTYDGESLRIYIDGKVVGESQPGHTRPHGDGHLRIAGRPDGYRGFTEGSTDEVRIYSRALSPEEIAASHAAPSAPPTAEGLVEHRHFDPETDEEQTALAHASVADLLTRDGGLLHLPEDQVEAHWSPAHRTEVETARAYAAELDDAQPPPLPTVLAVAHRGKTEDLQLHSRGDHTQAKGDPIPRGLPAQLGIAPIAIAPKSGGRSELAQWIASPENPLTVRVLVNRIWQAHFGQSLVPSPDNFGPTGQPPTHPELLDWLARDFIASGWSIKHLHRRILLSHTWQMSSADQPDASAADPDNRLLWRHPPRRLEAEMVRDNLLAASGLLDPAIGGSLTDFKNHGYVPKVDLPHSHRRAIYLPVIRDRVDPAIGLFDFPPPSASAASRDTTTVPLQALFFLNSPLAENAAAALAESLPENADQTTRIQTAYRRSFGREADDDELARALDFLKTEGTSWIDLCSALLASNEFIYLD